MSWTEDNENENARRSSSAMRDAFADGSGPPNVEGNSSMSGAAIGYSERGYLNADGNPDPIERADNMARSMRDAFADGSGPPNVEGNDSMSGAAISTYDNDQGEGGVIGYSERGYLNPDGNPNEIERTDNMDGSLSRRRFNPPRL